jgi:hypothetical protein
LPHQDDKALATSDAGVEQITLQHRVVLRHDRDHDGRVLRALALVDGRGVGRHQGIKFAKAVSDRSSIETGGKLTFVWIDILHVSDVAVADLLVVIVFDLHDFVARREGPAEPLDFALTRWIQWPEVRC